MAVRGVRGAISVQENTAEAIVTATQKLLIAMQAKNGFAVEDIASCWLTTTSDLTAQFPAVAARKLGWTDVALMCGHEMDVPNSLPLCIRVMIHWNTDLKQKDIQPVYLEKASVLRPDCSPSDS